MSRELDSVLDPERLAECRRHDAEMAAKHVPTLSLFDQALRAAVDGGVATRQWPLPPSRTFAQIQQECQAEARAIVRSAHHISRESTGTGLSDSTRAVCVCGWKGPLRYQYQDDMCAGLVADGRAHLALPLVDSGPVAQEEMDE